MKRGLILLLLFATYISEAQQSKTGKKKAENIFDGYKEIVSKDAVVIQNVPSYLWRHGCGPTALGMLVGYYDMFGFSDFIPGDASVQTTYVDDAIANEEHYADYSEPIDSYPNLLEDKSELGGAHNSNCIADFMETSWSSENNYYGWSWSSDIAISFRDYIHFINPAYSINTSYEWFSEQSWGIYKENIDDNKPVVLLVDSDGDGSTDHFVTGIGYDEENALYACYNTWDNDIHWSDWREMSDQWAWGIYGFSICMVQFSVSAEAEPLGSGSVIGSGTFDYQEQVYLFAEANEGFEFVNWTHNGNIVSTEELFIFNVSENLDLQANFTTESEILQSRDNGQLVLYPNPADDIITVEDETEEIIEAKIVDMQGKELLKKEFKPSIRKKQIEIYTIKSGIYMLYLLRKENSYICKKLIITK